MTIKQIGKGFNFQGMMRKASMEKNVLPRKIAITAKNWYLLGFRKGGGQTDAGAWEKRKKADVGKRRGVLVQSGKLRNSISVISATWDRITIGSKGIVYAAIHNYGLMGKAWGKHSFKMPKREFLGTSKKLNRKIITMIKNRFKKVIK